MVGGIISLAWCLSVLALSLIRTTPGSSLFPEIDFVSKLSSKTNPSRHSLQHVLSMLSTANSYEISRELAHSKFYVRINPPSPEMGNDKATSIIEWQNVNVNEMGLSESSDEVTNYVTVGQVFKSWSDEISCVILNLFDFSMILYLMY